MAMTYKTLEAIILIFTLSVLTISVDTLLMLVTLQIMFARFRDADSTFLASQSWLKYEDAFIESANKDDGMTNLARSIPVIAFLTKSIDADKPIAFKVIITRGNTEVIVVANVTFLAILILPAICFSTGFLQAQVTLELIKISHMNCCEGSVKKVDHLFTIFIG